MSGVEYCWSTDEEHFSGSESSRAFAAVHAASEVEGDLEPGDTTVVYTGEQSPIDMLRLLGTYAADSLIERMSEAAYDEVSEYADRFADCVSKESKTALQTKLEALVVQWAREYGIDPKLYTVVETVEHTVRRGNGADAETIYLDNEALT